MSYKGIHSRPFMDPHGYAVIGVDETRLSESDRRAALEEGFTSPQDWRRYLTPEELQALDKSLAEAEQSESEYFYHPPGYESPQKREKLFEAARLGLFRAYARAKYANGGRYWYGDGVPWASAGN